jgi:hypothetical protein
MADIEIYFAEIQTNMDNILKTELRFITMIMCCDVNAIMYPCERGMAISGTLMQYISILSEEKTDQLWEKARRVVLEDDATRKACMLSELEKWDFEPKEKKELIDLFLETWDAGYNNLEMEKIRERLIKRAELRLAQKMIANFQKRIESNEFYLKEACNEFYESIPLYEQPIIKSTILDKDSKIYWNPDKIFDTLLELEQSFTEHRMRYDTKSVLKCYINKEIEFSEEKIKELFYVLGLDLVVLTKI